MAEERSQKQEKKHTYLANITLHFASFSSLSRELSFPLVNFLFFKHTTKTHDTPYITCQSSSAASDPHVIPCQSMSSDLYIINNIMKIKWWRRQAMLYLNWNLETSYVVYAHISFLVMIIWSWYDNEFRMFYTLLYFLCENVEFWV